MFFKYIVEYPIKVIAIGRTANGLTFTGIAKCSQEDTFNVKVGKEIARAKAELKQLKHLETLVGEQMGVILQKLQKQNKRLEKIKKQKEKIEKRLVEFQ